MSVGKSKKCCLARSPADYESSDDSDSSTDSDVEKAKSQLVKRGQRKQQLASPTENRCCSDAHCCCLLVAYTLVLLYLFVLCVNFHDLLEPRDKFGYKC